MNEKPPTSLISTIKNSQYVEALNEALLQMYNAGAFWWDDYFGSFIVVDGKVTYPITTPTTNYYPLSRDIHTAACTSSTVSPRFGLSFDDTYRMAQFTATAATANFERTALHTSQGQRVSFSIWLKAGATPPESVTLSLITGSVVQATKTITITDTPNRYHISTYLNQASGGTRCRVTWTGVGTQIQADAAQYELTDSPTELVENPSETTPATRTQFVSPERITRMQPYKYNQIFTFRDLILHNRGLMPYEHRKLHPIYPVANIRGGMIVLDNIPADTHMVYYGKHLPPTLASDTDTVTMPQDAVSVLLAGARAFVLAAAYDIGSNTQVIQAQKYFEDRLEQLVDTYCPRAGMSTALYRVEWY